VESGFNLPHVEPGNVFDCDIVQRTGDTLQARNDKVKAVFLLYLLCSIINI